MKDGDTDHWLEGEFRRAQEEWEAMPENCRPIYVPPDPIYVLDEEWGA